MSKYALLSPADIASRNDENPVFSVGQRFYDQANDRVVQYVKFDNGSAIAAVAGNICYWLTYASGIVTSDISDSKANLVAGVFLNVLTDQYYGFIQIGGRYATVKTDLGNDVAKGDWVIAHATSDGVVDRTAAGTAAVTRPIGVALADDIDADDTVDTLILLDEGQ